MAEKRVPVTVTYLEMLERPEPVPDRPSRLELQRAWIPNAALNRFFYATVGADWLWHRRLPWTYERWHDHIARQGYETWIGYLDGSPAGFFELDGTNLEAGLEIMYFGLLPEFIGRGIGADLLANCVERAWSVSGVDRVHLTTCSFDHPRALPNYHGAGFVTYRVEETSESIPAEPLEPWPGSKRKPATSADDYPLFS